MKKAICAMALIAIGAVGCSNNKSSSIPVRDTVADVSAVPAPAATSYQPAQPVIYDSAPTSATPAASSMAGGNGSYTVKRGDTLYGIARQRYGDGKQWTKIASANPGLRPEGLRVGQTIVVP